MLHVYNYMVLGLAITGLAALGRPELIPKRLGLLKEVVPGASRVAVLWHPGVYSERTMGDMLNETEAAARTRGCSFNS